MNKKPTIHIASCSFGKDSIATILLALENNEPLDRIVFAEVMFDHSKGISGEIPEHIEWIYNTAIPKLEGMGVKVDVVRSDMDYVSFFTKAIGRGKFKGKLHGFPIGGRCVINGGCKINPIHRYYKQYKDCEIIQYIGIAQDEPKGLHDSRLIKYLCLTNMDTREIWLCRSAKNTILSARYTLHYREAAAGSA